MTQISKFTLILPFFFSFLMFTSCTDREEIIETVSESEAVEIIGATLTNTILVNLEDLSEELIEAVVSGSLCDSLYTKSVDEVYDGANVQGNYQSDLSFEIGCNVFNIPETAIFSSISITRYTSANMESDDGSDFNGNVEGLQLSSPSMTFNGVFGKIGTQKLGLATPKNIDSDLSIDFTNIEVSKLYQSVESGSGTFVFTGTAGDTDFLFEGDIVFNGDKSATITINGISYDIEF